MWLTNSTPSSPTLRSPWREKTWKPPESVSIGSRPGREPVQAAHGPDHVLAGTQVEVIGITQDDLRPGALDFARVQAAHRAVGPDRHERGRFHDAVGQYEAAGARVAVRGFWHELEHGGKL